MEDFWHEFRSKVPLFGILLVLFGTFLWNFARVYRRMFAWRATHASRLREMGEEARAQKVEADTALLQQRVPFAGRIIFTIGLLVAIGGLLALR